MESHEEAEVPDVVLKWCEENEVEPWDVPLACNEDWEEVYQVSSPEEKYSTVLENVLKHIPTGRFFRWEVFEPYLRRLGTCDIEEVFPEAVTVVVYRTIGEMKRPYKGNIGREIVKARWRGKKVQNNE